jgi:MFS family permease
VLPYTILAGLGFVLVGFGVSCVVPMVFSLAGRSKNMSSSSALASISTVGYFGFVVVPPFVGYVAQAINLRVAFGIIALFGALIVYFVSKIKENDTGASNESPGSSVVSALSD